MRQPRPTLLLALATAAGAGLSCHAGPTAACPDGYPAITAGAEDCGPVGPGSIAFAFIRPGSSAPALFITSADGRCVQRVTSDDAFYGPPAFFPGGRRLAYASTRSGLNALHLLDLQTGQETRLETSYPFDAAPTTLVAAAPAVSPDGATIAFEGSLPNSLGSSDLYTVPAGGGPVTRVTADPVAATFPVWSTSRLDPRLYFLSYRTGAEELYSARPDGAAVTRLTTGSALSSRFAVTGDGGALVYARHATGGAGPAPTELVALDLASGAVRVISSANEADPAVDAATRSVAVSRRSPTGYDLYLLDYASGAVTRQLTSCPGQAFGAAFAR